MEEKKIVTPEVTPDVKPSDKPAEVKVTEEVKLDENGKPAPKEPVKPAPGEDPVRFNLRQQLREAQDAKESSADPEEESYWSKRMTEIRGNLTEFDTSKKPKVPADPAKPVEVADEKTVKENLQKLGFASKEEILSEANKLVEQRLAQQNAEETQKAHVQAIKSVYEKRPDILADSELRTDLEKYVLNNYRVTPTTPAAKIAEWLQATIDRFAPPPPPHDPAAAKNAQEKVDLMNVTGDVKAPINNKKGSPADRARLKEAGWDDAKIDRFYS